MGKSNCKSKSSFCLNMATFILVVSSAVLLHDVSARAGDVSMGIAVLHIR